MTGGSNSRSALTKHEDSGLRTHSVASWCACVYVLLCGPSLQCQWLTLCVCVCVVCFTSVLCRRVCLHGGCCSARYPPLSLPLSITSPLSPPCSSLQTPRGLADGATIATTGSTVASTPGATSSAPRGDSLQHLEHLRRASPQKIQSQAAQKAQVQNAQVQKPVQGKQGKLRKISPLNSPPRQPLRRAERAEEAKDSEDSDAEGTYYHKDPRGRAEKRGFDGVANEKQGGCGDGSGVKSGGGDDGRTSGSGGWSGGSKDHEAVDEYDHETVCEVCGFGGDEANMLLCDECDAE